jgi:DNA-binding LacI/PurR family transcriptional regulator
MGFIFLLIKEGECLATINDVAKMAGVSKGTVSNVFSQKRPISKRVTERVLKIAQELNYKPNYFARSLVSKTTRIIGLNMPGEKLKFSQFHLSLVNGVLKECFLQGYRLLVNTLSNEFLSQVQHQSSDPVDGDILLDPAVNDQRIEDRLNRNLPIVVIGRPPEMYKSKVTYVDNDNLDSARQVAEYLLKLGHRQILFLNAPRDLTVSMDREAGYRSAFEQAGVPIDSKMLVYKGRGPASVSSLTYGKTTTRRLLKKYPFITAIIADTDKVALGVYQAAADLNLVIPRDLSVFAFNDASIFATEFTPPLSGVRLNGEQLGSEAARLLIQQFTTNSHHASRVYVFADLIFRGSCDKTSNALTKDARHKHEEVHTL